MSMNTGGLTKTFLFMSERGQETDQTLAEQGMFTTPE